MKATLKHLFLIFPLLINVLYIVPKCSAEEKALYRFAVIGDYGSDDNNELAVARMVQSWKPDFILTVGDNNYEIGASETIDKNIGKYYQNYIGNYMGKYGPGSKENRFFPTLGNHDWYSEEKSKPFTDYFTLPNNERYYDFVKENVHFFAIDSDKNEPDGVRISSKQRCWLEKKLQESKSKFKVVYFHHPPYSSGDHGSSRYMRWRFKQNGIDLVISGHDHNYERLEKDGLTYIVNGSGGKTLRKVKGLSLKTKSYYDKTHGSLLVTVYEDYILGEFYSISSKNTPIDSFKITPLTQNKTKGYWEMLLDEFAPKNYCN